MRKGVAYYSPQIMRPRKQKKRNILKRVSLLVFGAWLCSVGLFRFINPPCTPLVVIRFAQSVWDGTDRPQLRSWVPLSQIPIPAQQAIVAAEDARFMDHWGIDVWAIGEALEDDDSKPRGASTITMQTVKNIFLWPGRSYVRKIIEAGMAPIAGVMWGKRRTLELYLNIVEWGDGIYGIEEASKAYFHHSAEALTVTEAAALASILPNPRRLSPQKMSDATRKRFERVMREWEGTKTPTRYISTRSRKREIRGNS